MTGACCMGEARSRRLARKVSGAAASIVPGVVLVLLPKCPLCLAAWLTVATGIGVSVAAAARVRTLTEFLCVVILTFTSVQFLRRRASRHPHRTLTP